MEQEEEESGKGVGVEWKSVNQSRAIREALASPQINIQQIEHISECL